MPRSVIAKILTFLGALWSSYCLSRVWGGGWSDPAMGWFMVLLWSVFLTLLCAIAVRYYQSKETVSNVDAIGLETLNKLAEQQRTQQKRTPKR